MPLSISGHPRPTGRGALGAVFLVGDLDVHIGLHMTIHGDGALSVAEGEGELLVDDLRLGGIQVDEEDELPEVVLLQGLEGGHQPSGQGLGLGDSTVTPGGRERGIK